MGEDSTPLLRKKPSGNVAPTSSNTSKSAATKKNGLINYNELEEWQKDNEYVLTSYRPPSFSYYLSFLSLIYIHNDTVNIYSHLIGSTIFFVSPFYVYHELSGPRYASATWADLVVWSTFFFGVAICFALSATFHIVQNHSPKTNIFGNQLDYLGIVILMWGSTLPSIHYGFHCHPALQALYTCNVSLFATLCIYATFHPSFRSPRLRPYRALMYACLGLSAISFVVHGWLKVGWEEINARMSVDWMGVMAVLNLSGAVLYAARWPEKMFPGTFDVWGASHQWLHVLVIGAGIAHWVGLRRAYDFNHSPLGMCP
ncbi:hypothetical protein MMC25_005977 [Agyrium rufum]|nr:hypothetical protein [Agyrium rufum]